MGKNHPPYLDFLKFSYTQRTGSWLSVITLVAYILTKVSVTALEVVSSLNIFGA